VGGLTRRGLLGSGLLALGGAALAEVVTTDIASLKPGQFTWHPERSPAGPVAIIVSIPEQRVHVYRNGIRIAVSTCSTGKPGHETPTGVFTILQKDKDHRSSTYNNAPMPNMNRLTWDGIALHAGKLPGYPASHGCVRLPMDFSEKLFGVTHVGTPVILAGAHSDPVEIVHPGLLLAGSAEQEAEAAVAKLKPGTLPTTTATTLLASSADRRLVLLENGRDVAETRLADGVGALGEHVFVMVGADGGGLKWHGIGYSDAAGKPVEVAKGSLTGRLAADPAFVAQAIDALHPGALFVTTELPLTPDRRSGKDFVILST
jgi:hypothetical protein